MAGPSAASPIGHLLDRQMNGSPHIRTKLFRERLASATNLYRKDLLAHFGCVNAIEFSEEGELLVSGGDDRRILLWSISDSLYGTGSPVIMETSHNSNIFCLSFDSTNSKIFSGGNDDQVIIHDTKTGHLIIKLLHRKPVYGLSLSPQNDTILATAGDDGRVLIFDLRESANTEPLCLTRQKNGVYSVKFNPMNPKWLVTANSEEGITLWDIRKPKDMLLHYDANAGEVSGVSACFNSTGSHLLALRRRLPPVLYETQKENAVCQFYHPQYYNSCTMKTCTFAGENDEYVLSGSDDFNMYMWRIPEDDSEWGQSHMVLHGHRSIVNQVRYNKRNNFIASSGVEKMIKLWTPFPIGTWSGSLVNECNDSPRSVYTHEDYVYLVGHGGRISHDYSDQSTQEDSKMMAFFDSLIQREIEYWNSDDSLSSASDSDTHENMPFEKVFHKKYDDNTNRKNKPNRIAQLIAQKRCRLAKMAQGKASSSLKRGNIKEKLRKRKLALKCKSSLYGKTNGLTLKKSKHNNNNNSTNIPNPSCSSSTPSSSGRTRSNGDDKELLRKLAGLRKYRTRQSLRDDSVGSTSSLDGPSTSTGITGSSNSVFRIVMQDSDEEPPVENEIVEDNLVNILPTPLNGSHDMYVNVLEMSGDASGINGNSRATHATPVDASAVSPTHPKLNGDAYSDTDSDYEFECRTPSPVASRKRTRGASASVTDSGCGSSGTVRAERRGSDDEYECVSFKRRVKKAKLNIRKHIGADSDSN